MNDAEAVFFGNGGGIDRSANLRADAAAMAAVAAEPETRALPVWRGKALVRLVLRNDKVVGEERLLTDLNERFRDVIAGPDGALYVATDAQDGRILRVAPMR